MNKGSRAGKRYFSSTHFGLEKKEKLPICDEISRLFNMAENLLSSAGALRRLVGQSSKKDYFMDGSQQDICEFLLIILFVYWCDLSARCWRE